MRICVTGATGGVGSALCRRLIADGHEVWGIARREDALKALVAEPGDVFRWSVTDVADVRAVTQWAAAMHTAGFEPDALILVAAVQLDDMHATYDHATGRQVLDVNLGGALACIEVVLPGMLARCSGRIIAVSSSVALRPSVRSASYAASKAGLAMAMRSLSQQYAKKGVSFGTVFLGPVDTGMWEGKSSFLVPRADAAASAIAAFVQTRATRLYYPALSMLLLRLSLWLPDSLFSAVSSRLLK